MGSYACSILGLSVIAVLLAGYLGQKYLPPPTPRVVGIDLGTTYSCVGVYQAVTGEVRVIPDSDGHKCIPSVVGFREDGWIAGHKAASQSQLNPSNTIYDAKRFIGQKFSDEELAKESERYPFKMLSDEGNDVLYNINIMKMDQSKDRRTELVLTPEHIGSFIIQTLKETAQKNLSAPVTKAVMAVPAEFNERQRNYTKKAAALAGINVLRVINEPTAAALAYGLHKKEGVQSVMVVDLGGGTLDVSLLHIQGGMFVTVAMAGNSHLGGQDFTHRVLKHFLGDINSKTGRPLKDASSIQSLRDLAENTKLHLTYHDRAQVDLPLKFGSGDLHWKSELTVDDFNEMNRDLFQKVLEPIQRILQDKDISRDEVDEIVLVGGSTRVPKIRQIIRDYFEKDLNTAIDPEIAVTLGVSIQAGILGGMWPLEVSAIEVPSAVKKIHLH